MVAKVKEVDADALGMSGLLVKSTLIMRENLEELNSLGLTEVPVLLGGAALTRRYVERDLREVYEGRLFYGRDAFEGLSTLDALMGDEAQRRVGPRLRPGADRPGAARAHRSPTTPAVELPRRVARRRPPTTRCSRPPFLGSRVVKGIVARRDRRVRQRDGAVPQPVAVPAREGRRRRRPETDDEFKARIRPTFREQLAAAKASGVLVPQVVYGYFPANGDGDDLVVWTDESRTTEAARFHYPRQKVDAVPVHRRLLPARSSRARSTTPRSTSSRWARRSARRRPSCSPPTSTSSTCCCTASASRWPRRSPSTGTSRIREEWGFVDEDGPTIGGLFRQQYRGGRYSWGYPACPDLEDNATVARAARRRAPRHRGRRGDRLAVPARADHLGDHLPPPPGQVLRRPLSCTAPRTAASGAGVLTTMRDDPTVHSEFTGGAPLTHGDRP